MFYHIFQGENSKFDYMEDEEVNPAVITIGDTAYRTPVAMWFPLQDLTKLIVLKQTETGQKFLPKKMVFRNGSFNFVDPVDLP